MLPVPSQECACHHLAVAQERSLDLGLREMSSASAAWRLVLSLWRVLTVAMES